MIYNTFIAFWIPNRWYLKNQIAIFVSSVLWFSTKHLHLYSICAGDLKKFWINSKPQYTWRIVHNEVNIVEGKYSNNLLFTSVLVEQTISIAGLAKVGKNNVNKHVLKIIINKGNKRSVVQKIRAEIEIIEKKLDGLYVFEHYQQPQVGQSAAIL